MEINICICLSYKFSLKIVQIQTQFFFISVEVFEKSGNFVVKDIWALRCSNIAAPRRNIVVLSHTLATFKSGRNTFETILP